MGFNLNRLKEVAKQATEKEREEARFRDENRDWLLKSSLIALEIHRYMRLNGMNQTQLAEKLGVSGAMVSKLLSGKENLSLKTICGLEEAMGVELLQVPSYEKENYVEYKQPQLPKLELKYEGSAKVFCKVVNLNVETETKKKTLAV